MYQCFYCSNSTQHCYNISICNMLKLPSIHLGCLYCKFLQIKLQILSKLNYSWQKSINCNSWCGVVLDVCLHLHKQNTLHTVVFTMTHQDQIQLDRHSKYQMFLFKNRQNRASIHRRHQS